MMMLMVEIQCSVELSMEKPSLERRYIPARNSEIDYNILYLINLYNLWPILGMGFYILYHETKFEKLSYSPTKESCPPSLINVLGIVIQYWSW